VYRFLSKLHFKIKKIKSSKKNKMETIKKFNDL